MPGANQAFPFLPPGQQQYQWQPALPQSCLAGLSSPVFLGLMGCGESFCLAVAQLLLSTQNQALFPCFVSAMLSSVTTELAVAAFLGSLGCISAGSIAESFFGWFAGAFHS
ncbi:hypothetical protein BDE02_03G028700 [Populus trichocarpa]|nr:hypothetical protein BDE02_03G028700 [Populus trichocarpa]